MTAAKFPAGLEMLERSYEGACTWRGGVFHDRAEVIVRRAAERGPHGGVVLRTRRVVEESPSLDGTRATVGAFERLYGRLVRVPSRAVNVRVTLVLASLDGAACRVWVVADGALAQLVDVPAEGVAEVSLAVALTKRDLDLSVAADLAVPSGTKVPAGSRTAATVPSGVGISAGAGTLAGAEAADKPVELASGSCAVELVSLAVEEAAAGEGGSPAAKVDSLASVQAGTDALAAVSDGRAQAVSADPRTGSPASRPTVFVVSDSLAQTYDASVRPQTGWGEALARYLGIEGCVVEHDARFTYAQATRYAGATGPVVVNAAMAGRSARSFFVEGKLAQVLACVRPGDVLVFQFGANDATRARPLRYASPEAFEGLLARYVTAARDRGATPVVVTPPPRHTFDATGHLTIDFAAYAEVERAYCAREGVALVDLSALGGEIVAGLGPERSRALYMKLSAGQYASHPDGIDDSTHLSALGARTFGRIVARGVAEAVPALVFVDDAPADEPGLPTHLEARIVSDGVRPGVALSWDADPAATYYTVDCFGGEDGEDAPARMTSLLPGFFDVAVPGRPPCVRYEVRAWRGNATGPVARVAVTHEFVTDASAERRITGVDLYEVDAAGIADRINFSVRFNAHAGVETYRVLARNAKTGQLTALGAIEAAHVDDLHSYGVSREPGWEVYVEGAGPEGPCQSDVVSVPYRVVDAATARSSWEVPF